MGRDRGGEAVDGSERLGAHPQLTPGLKEQQGKRVPHVPFHQRELCLAPMSEVSYSMCCQVSWRAQGPENKFQNRMDIVFYSQDPGNICAV